MVRKVTAGLVLAVSMVAVPAAAQGSLAPGLRVRVLAPTFSERRPVGQLHSVDSTGLRLVRGADVVFIPRTAVMAVDVSAGHRSHWVRGLAIGGLAGLTLATVAFIADQSGDEDPLSDALDQVFFPAVATVLGGTGALVGGVIGAIARTEQWDRVPASDIRWSAGPVVMGVGVRVGVALRF
jgi:hypothetical protein